jgi:predicted histone-like DNA-binding protein
MLFIKKYQYNNRKNEKAFGKWYGKALILDTVETDSLCEAIEEKCTVHSADVKAVLIALKKVVAEKLQSGYRVHLEGLGFLKLGVRTSGAETMEDFNSSQHVKSTHVLFQPEKSLDGSHFTNPLTAGVRFRDAASLTSDGAGSGSGSGNSGGNSGGGSVEEEP